jgi:hypothetical protein
MKKYLAMFIAPVEAYDKMKEEMKNKTPEQQQAEMEGWKTWMTAHAANIVDHGGGLGKTMRVKEGGSVEATRNELGGYMIIQAETPEEAAAIYKDSPHFGVTGGWVDVMEISQM